MLVLAILLGSLAAAGIVSTLVLLVRDGYRAVPTDHARLGARRPSDRD